MAVAHDSDEASSIIQGARRRSIDNGTYGPAGKSSSNLQSNSSTANALEGEQIGGAAVKAPHWMSPDELGVYRSKALRSAVLSAAEGIKLRAAERKRNQQSSGGSFGANSTGGAAEIEELRKGGARDYAQPWSGTKMNHPDHAPKGTMRKGLGLGNVTAYTPPREKDESLVEVRPAWNPTTLAPPPPIIRVHQCFDPDTSVHPFQPALLAPESIPDIYFKANVLPQKLAMVREERGEGLKERAVRGGG